MLKWKLGSGIWNLESLFLCSWLRPDFIILTFDLYLDGKKIYKGARLESEKRTLVTFVHFYKMANRAPNLQKQVTSRLHGIMKKGNELNKKYGIKIAIFAEDSPANNSVRWAYQNDETFLSQIYSTFQTQNRFYPADFITVSEYHKQTSKLGKTSSTPFTEFEDDDLALLRAVGSGYASIEPPGQPSPALQQVSVNYRPSKRRRANSNVSIHGYQDPYNFTTWVGHLHIRTFIQVSLLP